VHKPSARTADVDNQDALSDALGGIVTSDTITLVGQDFYTVFSQAWGAIPLSERYIVSVHERPSARYGSLVWVEFRQRRVFQAFLPIARANVRPIAENAASSAFQNVVQADLTRLLFHEADMASDEL
jgi:curli production assembly/transport component CsgE